jgi:hypothetical protein
MNVLPDDDGWITHCHSSVYVDAWHVFCSWISNSDYYLLEMCSNNNWKFGMMRLIPSPHLLVLATNERSLPAGGNFRAILATESRWLQPVLVLSVQWWPAPTSVGRV